MPGPLPAQSPGGRAHPRVQLQEDLRLRRGPEARHVPLRRGDDHHPGHHPGGRLHQAGGEEQHQRDAAGGRAGAEDPRAGGGHRRGPGEELPAPTRRHHLHPGELLLGTRHPAQLLEEQKALLLELDRQPGRTGQHISAHHIEGEAVDLRHPPARLLHQQRPRANVPGLEAKLEEAVEAPGRHIGEVQRGAPRAADALSAADDAAEEAHGAFGPLAHVIGKPRAQQGPLHLRRLTGPQGPSVERGPLAPGRREELIQHRVVHHPSQHPLRPLHGQADAEMRDAVRVVRRPIQRIDEPPKARALGDAALLGQDGVARIARAQEREQRFLGGLVRVGHQVRGAALELDDALSQKALGEDPAPEPGSLFGDAAQRRGRLLLHGLFLSLTPLARRGAVRFPSGTSGGTPPRSPHERSAPPPGGPPGTWRASSAPSASSPPPPR
ncbi:hypothetical protein STIAU_7046 [Stigmatella aurantiaca DW4/3-1]|uniref:Uncharacterized protein n=1 Tax=Stigmatella aurantiaca (strain DW4/3-1) TaxID=378806 RepID=Q095D5_STIAD|nr:hypothetical protein STIAU_7046 [Stigmatella aurantiaca DW4/3-1]